jgi:hypothetical protein
MGQIKGKGECQWSACGCINAFSMTRDFIHTRLPYVNTSLFVQKYDDYFCLLAEIGRRCLDPIVCPVTVAKVARVAVAAHWFVSSTIKGVLQSTILSQSTACKRDIVASDEDPTWPCKDTAGRHEKGSLVCHQQ